MRAMSWNIFSPSNTAKGAPVSCSLASLHSALFPIHRSVQKKWILQLCTGGKAGPGDAQQKGNEPWRLEAEAHSQLRVLEWGIANASASWTKRWVYLHRGWLYCLERKESLQELSSNNIWLDRWGGPTDCCLQHGWLCMTTLACSGQDYSTLGHEHFYKVVPMVTDVTTISSQTKLSFVHCNMGTCCLFHLKQSRDARTSIGLSDCSRML